MSTHHPDSAPSACTFCGACCATYRVVFPATETDANLDGGVPSELTEPVSERACCMRGTQRRPRRCVALVGLVGKQVCCSIYERRPQACRSFGPDAAGGHGDPRCGDARRLHGLPPLQGSYDAIPLA